MLVFYCPPCPYRTPASSACPVLSSATVKAALDRLIAVAATLPPSPLIHLALVDKYLDQRFHPCSPQVRNFALGEILITHLKDHYFRLRHIYALPSLDEQLSYPDICDRFRHEPHPGTAEYLGSAFLYFHYVRVDLPFTHQHFSHLAGIDERSLRRYQRYALERLTLRLMKAEQASLERWQHQPIQLPLKLPDTDE
jgi:hypothetical protein